MKFKRITMELHKRIIKRVLVIPSLVLYFAFCMIPQKAIAQYDDAYISYNDFYENLAPYGQWIDDPQYGYVWSPNVDGSFRPYYTGGHWVMTDYGNTWVSDYPWGWACFHYGRWIYDSYYGWIWIPGSNWGPAWVSWRYGEGYYGWAPLGPNYDFTTAYGDYNCPNDWWVFIPPQYLYSGNYYRYWYGPRGNSHIIRNTVFINNIYASNGITYVSGPRVHDVEESTHQPVQVFKITNSNNLNTRVHNNIIKMYRPAEIRQAPAVNGQRVTPPNMVRAPQPIKSPQAVNAGQTTPPQFRNNLPNNGRAAETPGTNFNQTAQPDKRPPRNDNNPYEWDVNRPVSQPQQPDNSRPVQQTRQQEQPRQQQQPQQQNNTRQQPPVQNNQPQRQAPAPAPAPQRQSPAPAPAQRESGRR